MKRPEDYDTERRRILRRMNLLTWGIGIAIAFLALAGGALIAWILTGAGLPFVRTWLILSALFVLIPALVHLMPKPWKKDEPEE